MDDPQMPQHDYDESGGTDVMDEVDHPELVSHIRPEDVMSEEETTECLTSPFVIFGYS
jgi:hypothetical protein